MTSSWLGNDSPAVDALDNDAAERRPGWTAERTAATATHWNGEP